MTIDEAVAKLDADNGGDGEGAHYNADKVLLATVPPEVADAYRRLMERADFWAHA